MDNGEDTNNKECSEGGRRAKADHNDATAALLRHKSAILQLPCNTTSCTIQSTGVQQYYEVKDVQSSQKCTPCRFYIMMHSNIVLDANTK